MCSLYYNNNNYVIRLMFEKHYEMSRSWYDEIRKGSCCIDMCNIENGDKKYYIVCTMKKCGENMKTLMTLGRECNKEICLLRNIPNILIEELFCYNSIRDNQNVLLCYKDTKSVSSFEVKINMNRLNRIVYVKIRNKGYLFARKDPTLYKYVYDSENQSIETYRYTLIEDLVNPNAGSGADILEEYNRLSNKTSLVDIAVLFGINDCNLYKEVLSYVTVYDDSIGGESSDALVLGDLGFSVNKSIRERIENILNGCLRGSIRV